MSSSSSVPPDSFVINISDYYSMETESVPLFKEVPSTPDGSMDPVTRVKALLQYPVGNFFKCGKNLLEPLLPEGLRTKRALILTGSEDWNGAFSLSSRIPDTIEGFGQIQSHYNCTYKRISDLTSLCQAIDNEKNKKGAIHLLIIRAHGVREKMKLAEDSYFRMDDPLPLRSCLHNLDNAATIVLDSCYTGEGEWLKDNMANYIADHAPPQAKILAPLVGHEFFKIDKIDPLDLQFEGGTYKIDKEECAKEASTLYKFESENTPTSGALSGSQRTIVAPTKQKNAKKIHHSPHPSKDQLRRELRERVQEDMLFVNLMSLPMQAVGKGVEVFCHSGRIPQKICRAVSDGIKKAGERIPAPVKEFSHKVHARIVSGFERECDIPKEETDAFLHNTLLVTGAGVAGGVVQTVKRTMQAMKTVKSPVPVSTNFVLVNPPKPKVIKSGSIFEESDVSNIGTRTDVEYRILSDRSMIARVDWLFKDRTTTWQHAIYNDVRLPTKLPACIDPIHATSKYSADSLLGGHWYKTIRQLKEIARKNGVEKLIYESWPDNRQLFRIKLKRFTLVNRFKEPLEEGGAKQFATYHQFEVPLKPHGRTVVQTEKSVFRPSTPPVTPSRGHVLEREPSKKEAYTFSPLIASAFPGMNRSIERASQPNTPSHHPLNEKEVTRLLQQQHAKVMQEIETYRNAYRQLQVKQQTPDHAKSSVCKEEEYRRVRSMLSDGFEGLAANLRLGGKPERSQDVLQFGSGAVVLMDSCYMLATGSSLLGSQMGLFAMASPIAPYVGLIQAAALLLPLFKKKKKRDDGREALRQAIIQAFQQLAHQAAEVHKDMFTAFSHLENQIEKVQLETLRRFLKLEQELQEGFKKPLVQAVQKMQQELSSLPIVSAKVEALTTTTLAQPLLLPFTDFTPLPTAPVESVPDSLLTQAVSGIIAEGEESIVQVREQGAQLSQQKAQIADGMDRVGSTQQAILGEMDQIGRLLQQLLN